MYDEKENKEEVKEGRRLGSTWTLSLEHTRSTNAQTRALARRRTVETDLPKRVCVANSSSAPPTTTHPHLLLLLQVLFHMLLQRASEYLPARIWKRARSCACTPERLFPRPRHGGVGTRDAERTITSLFCERLCATAAAVMARRRSRLSLIPRTWEMLGKGFERSLPPSRTSISGG
jgi:hypothetical protein